MNGQQSFLALVLGGAALYIGIDVLKKKSRSQMAADTAQLRARILGIGLQENDVTVNVELLNPGTKALSVKSFVGDLFVNNTKVAALQMFGNYTADPANHVTMPIIAKVIKSPLVASAFALYKNKAAAISFRGTINVNNAAIPLTLNYTR